MDKNKESKHTRKKKKRKEKGKIRNQNFLETWEKDQFVREEFQTNRKPKGLAEEIRTRAKGA